MEGAQRRMLCIVITRLREWRMRWWSLWSSVIFLMGNGLRMIPIPSMNLVLAILSMNSSIVSKMEDLIKTSRNISGSQRDATSLGMRIWWISVVLELVSCFWYCFVIRIAFYYRNLCWHLMQIFMMQITEVKL